MKTEWTIITRLKSYIGEINYNKFLGEKFQELLDKHEFDLSIKLLLDSKLLNDNSSEKLIIKHIKSYKYAC